jgi:Fe-S-cluster-containing hydrogenase component 2
MDGPHGGPLRVVRGLCTGCLECIEICPADAIEARVETRVEARVKARVEAREEGR